MRPLNKKRNNNNRGRAPTTPQRNTRDKSRLNILKPINGVRINKRNWRPSTKSQSDTQGKGRLNILKPIPKDRVNTSNGRAPTKPKSTRTEGEAQHLEIVQQGEGHQEPQKGAVEAREHGGLVDDPKGEPRDVPLAIAVPEWSWMGQSGWDKEPTIPDAMLLGPVELSRGREETLPRSPSKCQQDIQASESYCLHLCSM